MKGTKSVKNPRRGDRQSASNIKKLINNIPTQKTTDEQPLERRQTPVTTTKENSREINEMLESSPSQTSTNKSHIKDCCGNITAPTIIWYIGTCILFIIALLALVLSVSFFINDTTTDRVIKLYGIIGATILVFITLIIVFINCWIDGTRLYLEEAVVYGVLQVKEADSEAMTMRGIREKVREDEEGKPKQLMAQQQSQPASSDLPPYPHFYHSFVYYPPPYNYHRHHSHHDHHSHRHHSHRIYAYSPMSHYQPIIHSDSQRSRHSQQNAINVSVDSSTKSVPVSRSRKTIHTAKRPAEPKLKIGDVIHGTHLDQNESAQTSTRKYTDVPDNVTEIIHETTIVQAPRTLLPTLRRTLLQQDKNKPNT